MGYFRCLSKPCKRFYFSHADKIADKWIVIVSDKYVQKYINKLNKNHRETNNIENDINDDNSYLEKDSDLEEDEEYPTDVVVLEYNLIPGLEYYYHKLKNKLEEERGLAHSKVREYWLRRGPRLLIVLLITLAVTIILSELLLERTWNDHLFSMLVGLNLILCSLYMLYQRLNDSISGAMMRIGHDHYNSWKDNYAKNENIMREFTIGNRRCMSL
jgi:hypothetical protein